MKVGSFSCPGFPKSSPLNFEEIKTSAALLLDPEMPDEPKAEFLKSLVLRGETPEELAGFVKAFMKYSLDPDIHSLKLNAPTLDIVGTGGDRVNLFNVSSTAMFIAAGAGVVVAKHGNRAVTSICGSADVLEKLGIAITMGANNFRNCLLEVGVGFLFAPIYRPIFKSVEGARNILAKENLRTLFNMIGPLMNPAQPETQLIGVADTEMADSFLDISLAMGNSKVKVIFGQSDDGRVIDEASTMGKTSLFWIENGKKIRRDIEPEEFGFTRAKLVDLQGGQNAHENAQMLDAILSGKSTKARRDMALWNAACAIWTSGLSDSLENSLVLAKESLESGRGLVKLRAMQEFSSKYY